MYSYQYCNGYVHHYQQLSLLQLYSGMSLDPPRIFIEIVQPDGLQVHPLTLTNSSSTPLSL